MILLIYLHFLLAIIEHPNHISYTDIIYNKASETFEITIKVIPDDFENALKKENCKNVDLISNTEDDSLQNCINSYIQKHFYILIGKKKIDLSFLGSEFKEKEYFLYFESEKLKEPIKLEVNNSILFKETKIQLNFVRYKSSKKDLSVRLKNPESNWVIK